jgi:hypothetical protein
MMLTARCLSGVIAYPIDGSTESLIPLLIKLLTCARHTLSRRNPGGRRPSGGKCPQMTEAEQYGDLLATKPPCEHSFEPRAYSRAQPDIEQTITSGVYLIFGFYNIDWHFVLGLSERHCLAFVVHGTKD